jgi:Fe-S cluster assembly protein SufD
MTIQVSMIPDLGKTSTAAERRSAALAALLETQSPLSDAPPWMQAMRDTAMGQAQALTLPSTRDEEWRFTDLSDLVAASFAKSIPAEFPPSSAVDAFDIPEASHRLVFANGMYCHGFSNGAETPGLFVGDLQQALSVESIATALQTYWAQQPGNPDVFTWLNTACFENIAVIWVGKNQNITVPIHVLSLDWDNTPGSVSHPRCLIVAEANSSVTIAEEFASLGTSANFCNSVTEIRLGENAQVNHTRIQRQSTAAFHIGKTAVSQARSSRYTCNAVSVGAKLGRHNLEIYQTGEQTETVLNGLTMIAGEQVADMHSAIALTAPHGMTRQVQKNIADDSAHAIFNGKVFVPKAAQLTDAGQLNRNLLLSPKARVDTKPQLEIVADNVKCTHGATVSQLEDDEVFYLQSRGIDAASAQKLLVYAFAFEVIEKIPIASLQDRLSQLVNVPE